MGLTGTGRCIRRVGCKPMERDVWNALRRVGCIRSTLVACMMDRERGVVANWCWWLGSGGLYGPKPWGDVAAAAKWSLPSPPDNLTSSEHINNQYPRTNTQPAKMSDSEERETKPFKFVTGTCNWCPKSEFNAFANPSFSTAGTSTHTPPTPFRSSFDAHILRDPYWRNISRLWCPLPASESVRVQGQRVGKIHQLISKQDQALLAKLCRLPQVHSSQGRGLCAVPSGTSMSGICRWDDWG